jgi:hypothetical protein
MSHSSAGGEGSGEGAQRNLSHRLGAWPRAPKNEGWREDLGAHPNLMVLLGAC